MKTINSFKVPEHGLQVEDTLAASDRAGVDHLVRYWWAWTVGAGLKPKVTFDIGCGCGYGSYILGEQEHGRVLGIDADRKALNIAHADYARGSANYLEFNVENHWSQHAALKGVKAGLVTCFEVLELLWHRDFFLHQLCASMADDGIALFSSQAKLRAWCNAGPKDARFHYNGDTLKAVLKRYFKTVVFSYDYFDTKTTDPRFAYLDTIQAQVNQVKEPYAVGRDLVYCAAPIRT